MYVDYNDRTGIEALIGKTLVEIKGMEKGSDEIIFVTDDGTRYGMYHSQDCCESVDVEDVNGDVEDLLNSPILEASERTSEEPPEGTPKPEYGYDDATQWMFYHLVTGKGTVVLRWYGTSNGYYGIDVSFGEMKKEYNHE